MTEEEKTEVVLDVLNEILEAVRDAANDASDEGTGEASFALSTFGRKLKRRIQKIERERKGAKK